MTGGEMAAIGKAANVVGKKALGEDEKTKDVLLRAAEETPEIGAAARSMAARVAVKEWVTATPRVVRLPSAAAIDRGSPS
jgi:hypothetical protein